MGAMDALISTGAHNATTAPFIGAGGLASLLPQVQTVEVLVAVSIFVAIHSLRQRRSLGLPSWPVVGMLPSLLLGVRGDMYEWITGVLKARGGTFTFCGPWFTNLHCVVTADPRNLEHLLKTKFGNFPKGPYFRDTVRDLLGDGIFGADDEVWRQQRKAASLEFHSAEFRALTASSLVELVHRRLLPVLAETEAAGAAVDLQDVLLRLTFDNVCMIAFGADPGCLQKGLPEIPFARAFEDATEATIVRFVTPTAVWRGMRALGVGHERVLRRSLAGVDEFAYDVIRKRREELAAAAGNRPRGGRRRAPSGRPADHLHQDARRRRRPRLLGQVPPRHLRQLHPGRARHVVRGAGVVLLAAQQEPRRGGQDPAGGRGHRGGAGSLWGGGGGAGVPAGGGEADGVPPRRALRGAPALPVRPRRPQGGCGGRGVPRRHGAEEGHQGDLRHVLHGEDGEHLGGGLQGVQAGAVAQGRPLHGRVRLQVHRLQRRPAPLPRQGLRLLPDEVRRRLHPPPLPRRRRPGTPGGAQAGAHALHEAWPQGDAGQEGRQGQAL
ncbi:hypothetical protein CFC21_011318, partial [Triticum aestivum]